MEFTPARVIYKSGKVIEIPLNYNTLTEEMVFEQQGQLMAIDNSTLIDTIYLEGRKFIPSKNLFYEVIQVGEVPLFIRHKHKLIPPPKRVGYGGTSETSATNTFNSIQMDGNNYQLETLSDYKLKSEIEYFIWKNKRLFKTSSTSQFVDAYPSKKKLIKKLVKEQVTNFSKTEDVLKLLYAIQQQ
jgi:hypothetical protein